MEFINTNKYEDFETISNIKYCLEESITRFPAIAVSAVINNEILYMKTIGSTSKQEDGKQISEDNTVFKLASISKTFMAVIVLQCVERNEINLNQDINFYLSRKDIAINNPYFKNIPITPYHLLTHCSSLIDDESALLKGSIYRSENKDCDITLEEYVKNRLGNTKDFEIYSKLWRWEESPGKSPYHYSNAGFTLLGLVVQIASNKTLQDLLNQYILQPLSMFNTSYMLSEINNKDGINIAIPHDIDNIIIGNYGVAEW